MEPVKIKSVKNLHRLVKQSLPNHNASFSSHQSNSWESSNTNSLQVKLLEVLEKEEDLSISASSNTDTPIIKAKQFQQVFD